MSEQDLIDLEDQDSHSSERRRSFIPQSVRKFGIPLPGMAPKTRSASDKEFKIEMATQNVNLAAGAVRKFDGKNFNVWKAQIESYMTVKGCIEALKDPKTETDDFRERDMVARAILLLALTDDQASLVCHLKTARAIWKRLLEAYQQKSKASRISLQRQFFEVSMREDERAIDYVSRLQSLHSQLLDTGLELPEETLVGKIVSGLSSKFHVFITNWSSNASLNQTLAELVPRLTAEESLIKKFSRRGDSVALSSERQYLAAKKKERSTERSTESDQKKSPSQKKKFIERRKCYNCGRTGHIARACKDPKKEKSGEQSKNNGEAVVAESLVAEANVAIEETNWIIDSGASDHMTYDAKNFITLRSCNPTEIRVANKNAVTVKGIGEIRMTSNVANKKREIVLRNVLYVPGLRRKLLSIGASGLTGEIKPDKIVLKRMIDGNEETLIEGRKNGNLYHALIEEISPPSANIAEETQTETSDGNLELWHERLSHVNRSTIVRMAKHNIASGLECLPTSLPAKDSDRRIVNCESCVLAKHARVAIPLSQRERASDVGHRLHLDICGPIGQPTLAGSKYLLLLKDECSNYRFIYLMKSRDEAYELLKKCIAQIKSDTTKAVLCIVSDNGSEFTSIRTKQFLADAGISHKLSAPFLPQQNGFIERDNRTLMEATRAMLYHRNMPEYLWGEAANTAVYILNRVVNSNNKDKTPFELYFGTKPRLAHLRIFGSVAYMKTQEKKRSGYQKKLDPRSSKMIMVGYNTDRDFTYRIFDPHTKKTYITRDVIFDEKDLYFKERDGCDHLKEYIEEMSLVSGVDLTGENGNDVDEANAAMLEHHLSIKDEPMSYQEALRSDDAKEWTKAMREEYDSLIKNKTWRLETLPFGKNAIRCKWVYKLKRKADGTIARYKARLVAKGYSQKKGIDYEETFSPVVRMESVRLILSLVAKLDLDVVQFDVRTAFLYGELTEELYMQQPEGFESGGRLVCRLIKSIYGLKQASKVWNDCFVNFLKEFKLETLYSDSCVLVRRGQDLLIIAIYVDDGLLCSNNKSLLQQVVSHLRNRFEITTSNVECFLGLNIHRNRAERLIEIHQAPYIERMLERFELEDANVSSVPMAPTAKLTTKGVADGADSKSVDVPYRELIGSLLYLMGMSRPDIACAVSILSRFVQDPKLPHWVAAKTVLKYLKGTTNLVIRYSGSSPLLAYSDADYAACCDTRKSITGLVVQHCGGPIVWKATKQTIVVESTTEAEFVACSTVSREVLWLRHFLEELGNEPLKDPTDVMVDNQSAIRIVKNNQIHSKIKQLDVRMMAIRDRVASKEIDVKYVSTEEQTADIFTKPLPAKRFNYLRSKLGLHLLLLYLFMLVATQECQSLKLNFRLPASKPSQSTKILLKLIDPCKQVEEIENALVGQVELSASYKANASIVAASKLNCDTMFKSRVLPAFEDLGDCLPAQRDKRDVIAVFNAVAFTAKLIVGVTNLVRGAFVAEPTGTRAGTIEQLEKDVKKASESILTSRSAMKKELEEELSIVSRTAQHHIEQIKEEAAQGSMMIWVNYHVASELHAGAANLRTLRQHCRKRELATVELGEMLELDELSSIAPEDTILDSVVMDVNGKQVEFEYTLKEMVEVTLEEILGCFATFAFIILILTVVCMSKRVREAVRKTEKVAPPTAYMRRHVSLDI